MQASINENKNKQQTAKDVLTEENRKLQN